MSSSRLPGRLSALAGALLVVALAVGGCSSADDSDGSGDSETAARSDAGGSTAAEDAPADGVQAAMGRPGDAEAEEQPAFVISTGTVSLESDDVAQARFDVQQVVDRARGRVSDEETRTDEDGEVRTSRMMLRVPSDAFTATMDELEDVAELRESTRFEEDVTTQVVDNRVRIRVQRASIRRIEALLSRAVDIGDVVRIESELSQRQAELNSLLRRQAYLADQTSMSTITVHLERSSERASVDDDDAGFLSGLDAGWGALVAFTVALVTVVGALLPWLAVLLVIALPLWWLRRTRRRRAEPASSPPDGVPAG